MKISLSLLILTVAGLISACRFVRMQSGPSYKAQYDTRNHRSHYEDSPFADIILPGKWWRATNANGAVSASPVFYNEDSTFVWLDRYPKQQFNFDASASTNDSIYLEAYFRAVSNNWERQGLKAVPDVLNYGQHFIICRTQPEYPCCTMHLIGCRRQLAYLISITGNMEEGEKSNLLESLFMLN